MTQTLPVRRDSAPNSKINVPMPATHVTVVSPLGTPPSSKLTVPYGIPVGVSKAGNSLEANTSACLSNGPEHGQDGSTSNPALRDKR